MYSLKSLNISNFDTTNVSNMTFMISMFNDCSSLEYLDASNFNVLKVKNIGNMFRNLSSLIELNLSN